MKHLNIGFPPRTVVLGLREIYKPGTRVKLVSMEDDQAPPEGTLGTVTMVDDIGSLCVDWDNGSHLHVVYDVDHVVIL